MEALQTATVRVVAVIAEGVPEKDTKRMIAYAKANGKVIIGPATVGGVQVGLSGSCGCHHCDGDMVRRDLNCPRKEQSWVPECKVRVLSLCQHACTWVMPRNTLALLLAWEEVESPAQHA